MMKKKLKEGNMFEGYKWKKAGWDSPVEAENWYNAGWEYPMIAIKWYKCKIKE